MPLSNSRVWIAVMAIAVLTTIAEYTQADDPFERAPIEYSKSDPDNAVSRLQAKLERGEATLKYDPDQGYLPAVLDALGVPTESQMLVFSKTSLQRRRISPRTPRAIYFNDDVYIGFCRAGEVMEISVADPQLGAVFYTIEQQEAVAPKLIRQTDNCLVCHSSSRTDGIPGHLARSVFTGPSGEPILSKGSKTVDYRTPFEDRWGGWYVTGTHGEQTHLGNFIVRGREEAQGEENADGQNVTDLADRLKVDQYLTAHSDIIALMVLEHQTLMHNRLTKANFETRAALYYQADLNRALGEPEDAPLESVTRRIETAAEDVVEALLFVDEAELTEPVAGTSGYAELFSELGVRDSSGRSLRDFDLERRLFKHPCSYLIYSEAFDSLPKEVKSVILSRLAEILRGEDASGRFDHLSAEDCQAIADILRDTKDGLPADWP
ncbi:MAG TPA: hypothetical protein VF175_02700 [Lacipirellula sp.]